MITKEETIEIVKKYGKNENDFGSTAVQIAIMTKRINNLMPHFSDHKHDFHSKRGLLKIIGKRRSLLKYYGKTNPSDYPNLIKSLGLRK